MSAVIRTDNLVRFAFACSVYAWNHFRWRGSFFRLEYEAAVNGSCRFAGTSLLTLLLCTPVAFFASYGRGYLPPMGFAFLG
ncbi:MAG: hypothetical protein ACM3WV_01415 [Bacillota bacterium]